MKHTIKLAAVAIALVVVLSGCMTYFGSESGKLAYAEIEGESKGQVSIEEQFLFIIHPDVLVLGDGGKAWENIDEALDPVLADLDANAVRNMELGYGATLIDMVLSSVVPVVNWGTYTIEGEAVQQ